MLKKKNIGIALTCALALGAWSGSTLATPVNVGGVWIDPDSQLNLTVDAVNFRETSVSAVGQILTGYGKIATINGLDQTDFCVATVCDIGFNFSYTVKSIDTTGPNPKVVFDMGLVNFYLDNTKSFSATNPNSASIGTLWLSVAGHAAPALGFSDTGELYSTIFGPVSSPGLQSNGFGLLDSIGGLAGAYFDTNTQPDGADFSFNSSFLTNPANGCGSTPSSDPNSICHYPISGTAELIAKNVPEPGAAGILGLGLAFLGLFAWRRNKEAEGRA